MSEANLSMDNQDARAVYEQYWQQARHVDNELWSYTKMVAVLFLGGMLLIEDLPWIVPFSALGDGAMGLAMTWVHLRRRREERDSR